MSFLQSKDNLNILTVGDPHISGKQALARKDDVVTIQFDKLEQVVTIANDTDSHLFFNGDIFDYPYVSYSIYSVVADILSKLKKKAYFVYGQHDLFVHNIYSKISTATGSLEASKLIHPISEFNKDYPNYKFDFLNWNDTLPKITKSKFLISHIPVVSKLMVLKNPWLYHSQDKNKFLILEDLLKYNLIICGDWHKRYIEQKKGTLLINPGAMVRREASEDERFTFPSVVLINLNSLKYEIIPLKTEEKVFNLSHLLINKRIQNVKSQSKEFINKLKGKKGLFKGSNFIKKVLQFTNSNEISKEQRQLMESIMERSFGSKYKKQYGVEHEQIKERSRITKIQIRET